MKKIKGDARRICMNEMVTGKRPHNSANTQTPPGSVQSASPAEKTILPTHQKYGTNNVELQRRSHQTDIRDSE